MDREIAIVDRGRGLQLSTSRITVQDLVPYFIEGCCYDEIRRWLPSLSVEEIQVVKRYFHEHEADLVEQDRRQREHTQEQVRLQRQRFPDDDRQGRLDRMKQAFAQRVEEKNGQGNSR